MKIKSDFLKIQNYQVDKDGQKVEPEQMLAERAVDITAPLSGSIDRQVKGNLRSEVVYTDTVGQFAQGIRRPCSTCKHFNNALWRRYYSDIERGNDPVDKKWLNGVRAALLDTQNAKMQDMHQDQQGDMDVEHALSFLGICQVFTEMFNPPGGGQFEPVVTHPMCVCPEVDGNGSKLPILYDPATKEHGREGSAAYDRIMQAAQKAQK